MAERPTSRTDVVALEGYHSPQMDVCAYVCVYV